MSQTLPNMTLVIPTVGNPAVPDGGPGYAQEINQALALIDARPHALIECAGILRAGFGAVRAVEGQICARADLDGVVNGADIALLLSVANTTTGCGSNCSADLNGDGLVNGADIGLMLSAWGSCGG